ncbi:MAG: TIGR04211 family SH3 domain-containing protein [Proteobacteria bacterium]|nr:TIGR04211 family SH3 domain-containing protein [Pseudomonadota bacterium]
MRWKRRLIIGFLALLPLIAVAETAYVTDNLRLGLYEAADTSGRPLRMLESGQAMEILTRDRNYANVRLPNETEGWVKAAYLVSDKPAKLIVAETIAQRDALATELEELKQAFAGPAATIEALKNDSAQLNERLTDTDARNAELEEDIAGFQGMQDRYKGSLPVSWVAGAIGVCLVAGFMLGLWWVDRRSRLRHGGIRIY